MGSEGESIVKTTVPRAAVDGRAEGATEGVESARDRFKAAWLAGEGPRIEDFVAATAARDRPALVRELIAVEVNLRRSHGQGHTLGEYRSRFPEHACAVNDAFGETPVTPGHGRPAPSQSQVETSRNLLAGVLAVQVNFIDDDELLAAVAAWAGDKSRPLARTLLDRGALDDGRCQLLESLVGEHLRQFGGDPEASLAAVSAFRGLCDHLERIDDADLKAIVAAVDVGPFGAGHPAGFGAKAVNHSLSSDLAGGRFRVLQFHREGGLGRIYIARDEELGRTVALKEIRPDKLAVADRGRFVLEAEINGGLEHPGIVPVYSLGTHSDGRPFYAMRFIDGESFTEAIEKYHKNSPRPDPRSLEFRKLLGRFIDVCEAIAFAHNKGVLHRDLKPHNVMLGRFGETLLIDWGLAKATGLRAPASPNVPREPTLVPASAGIYPATEGVLGGTPGYMSPEQAMTEARALGPATDIYGLGAILFQLLTSRPPVVGLDPNDIMARTIQGAVRSPRSLNPRVPRELEAVCLKALAPRWADRYPTAEALAEDIEHWLADEPVSAFPETPLQRLGRWNRKHRAVTRIAFFALGVTMVAISWPLWQAASNRIWAQENEAAAELILKDTHKIFREYENSPLKILNNLPVPILKNLPSALARPISDPLVRQAIADVVKEYKKTHTATGNRFLAGTTLYNRVISAMLSHTAEIESRMPGMLLDALMNLEESVTCQERAVALETANRPRIDDWLGFNLDNIKQYQTDLLEYYSRLVTILVRLDQGNAAKDRVDECLDRFRDSPKQLEEFAQFLKKRADELDRDAPRRELMTAELDKFIDDARRAQAVSNRSATRPAVTTVSPRDDFQEEAIKALVRSGPASPASGRQQALKWLRADLQLRKRQLASDDASTRQRARAFLRSWQTADGLAALREGAERTRLPEAEARECQSFWSDVESVLE